MKNTGHDIADAVASLTESELDVLR